MGIKYEFKWVNNKADYCNTNPIYHILYQI